MRRFRGSPFVLIVFVTGTAEVVLATEAPVPRYRELVEADWLLQESCQRDVDQRTGAVTTQEDAAGACDGVKDGSWGFHTAQAREPWWQVDLGADVELARVVVWNRSDTVANRAAQLRVLLSADAQSWRRVYEHDGTVFLGQPDGKPLVVHLQPDAHGRFVRLQLPGTDYLHLDEVEVFGPGDPQENLALHRPADQVSVSQWSKRAAIRPSGEVAWAERVPQIFARSWELIDELTAAGVDVTALRNELERLTTHLSALAESDIGKPEYLAVRWLQRRLALAHPLVPDEPILFAKRVPGSFSHMSDQYLGWWSRPGGGLQLLRNVRGGSPTVECISDAFDQPGSFLRPTLSWDGERVLFSWCRYYPDLAAEPNKLDKGNVPEDAFYHVFEMNIDGTGLRQLTRGKYDDFDARYLPNGRIVFLSTRRGHAIQCGKESARQTLVEAALPDVYVRCGGGPERPCTVYTLHTMAADGGDLCAISPFEMFEWTPSVAHDGTILYSRWDYVDRSNMPYMGLWRINPDGTNPRIVYANFTRSPHCTFEPQVVPGSHKIVFTASAHHTQTKGSLVLLDPTAGQEGTAPVRRLTPEVVFPEAEGWPTTYYANPWPLSERHYLVAWGAEGLMHPGVGSGWARWHTVGRPPNGMGIYLYDADGRQLELLYRDPTITAQFPMPVRARPRPPAIPSRVDWDGPQEGSFLVLDAYRGLKSTPRGTIRALRIVAVPPKTHPTMNYPAIGVTRDDPGKCVLGTVPVEVDGSAHFRVPSGVSVFFQALDERGMAVQTMRSATHVGPGETLACAGCHESRSEAPQPGHALAARRPPSRITPGPNGSWPLRFDRLVQPVLDRLCTDCHAPSAEDAAARKIDLTPSRAWETLVHWGQPSLADHVRQRYGEGRSSEGACAAQTSALLRLLTAPDGHQGVRLAGEDLERFIIWMDTYAQKSGSFSADQERRLTALRERCADLLAPRAE